MIAALTCWLYGHQYAHPVTTREYTEARCERCGKIRRTIEGTTR